MSSIVQHAPRFSEEDAVRIAHDLFSLDVTAQLLPSERDQNFIFFVSNGPAYVLKLANSTERIEVLDFQNQAMMHVARNKSRSKHGVVAVPEVCKSVKGEQITRVEGIDGSTHYVRLLTYLPGKPFARVKPRDAALLSSLGRFFGILDLILKDFDHPAAHRDFHWDLKNASRIIKSYIETIGAPLKIVPSSKDFSNTFKPKPNRNCLGCAPASFTMTAMTTICWWSLRTNG
jgi:Ser/Thr protein kinase RdoA (MazF antagonist)